MKELQVQYYFDYCLQVANSLPSAKVYYREDWNSIDLVSLEVRERMLKKLTKKHQAELVKDLAKEVSFLIEREVKDD